MSHPTSIAHRIRALPPALKAMQDLGYPAERCLEGTGLCEQDLAAPELEGTFSLDQEFRFHRNLLELSGDPMLGLVTGKAYTLQSYGLLGYAFLSAPTLRQALMIASNYALLTFSLFSIDFQVRGRRGILRFLPKEDIPADLVAYYVDRDLTASAFGGGDNLPEAMSIESVALMHAGGAGQARRYEAFFGCPVSFNAACSELCVDATILENPMPLRDPQTSALCQQQCQMLLARMSKSSGFVDQVRQLMMARPGYFPDIDHVAEKLGMTTRTLRRRLTDEGSGYQQILAELRYQLAREYLSTSKLPLEEISVLLGYSTPGNFTHAFKRWHGLPPRQYRQEAQ